MNPLPSNISAKSNPPIKVTPNNKKNKNSKLNYSPLKPPKKKAFQQNNKISKPRIFQPVPNKFFVTPFQHDDVGECGNDIDGYSTFLLFGLVSIVLEEMYVQSRT